MQSMDGGKNYLNTINRLYFYSNESIYTVLSHAGIMQTF